MRFIRYKKTTREKIMEATFDMLAEKGYKELTMRDIAKRAEAAVGQLTYYYRTKEKLVYTVLNEILTGLVTELKSKVSKSTNKREALLEYYSECCAKEPELVKVILSVTTESMYNDSIKQLLIEYNLNVRELIKDIYISEGMSEGESIIKANFVMSSISGLMALQVLQGDKNTEHEAYKKILLKI